MPRPPIPPELRQRAVKACGPCKSAKRRCDALLPCGTCEKRGIAHACFYPRFDRPRIKLNQIVSGRVNKTSSGTNSHVDQLPIQNVADQTSCSVEEPSRLVSDAPSSTAPEDVSPRSSQTAVSPRVPIIIRSRMLVDSRGEREFVGDAAALSFNQYLRELLAQHLSSSTWSENRADAHLPRTDLLDRMPVSPAGDVREKHNFIQSYLAATNGILDVYNQEELAVMMAMTNNAEETIPDESMAALYIAIAVGAQCRASCKLDLQYAKKYFYLGQKAAFQSMVEDPDIAITRCFVLMAFYMLGACRRNAAFMYIGIAAKSAYALGLHVPEHYSSTTNAEQHLRSRFWKSLRTLDIITNTSMGRLTASPPMSVEPEAFDISNKETLSHRELCLDATYRFTSMMDQIFHDILESKSIDINTGEMYLEKLNTLSATLPHDLRKFSATPASTLSGEEPLIGNIHVSCSYYWAVMLVTRPFLMYRLTCSQSTTTWSASPDISRVDPSISKLARICVWAGVHVAQNCHRLLRPGSLIHNLCILKSWIFSTSLVLGFSMLIPDDSCFDVGDAFAQAREVLLMLTKASPQAERYYDVMNSFAEAIYKHRQNRALERRKIHQNLLLDILSLDSDEVSDQQGHLARGNNTSSSLLQRGEQGLGADVPSHLQPGGNVPNDFFPGREENGYRPHMEEPHLGYSASAFHMQPPSDNLAGNLNAAWWDDFAMEVSQTLPFDCGFEP